MTHIEQMIQDMCPNGVEFKTLGEVCIVKTAPMKLDKKEYQEEGLYPIVDQGQKYIVGYTDNAKALVPADDYIIFGDHTREIKYVDFTFAQGADGVKILKTKNEILPRFLYHVLKNTQIPSRGYNRHWTIAKDIEIPIPPLEIQKKIVECLDKFSALAAELQAELQAELHLRRKQYEYYRTQLLTPHSDGNSATTPDDAQWENVKFSDVASYIRGVTYNKHDELHEQSDSAIKVLRANNITLESNSLNLDEVKFIRSDVRVKQEQYLRKNDIFICAGSGSKEHVGKVAFINEDMDYTFGGFMGVVRTREKVTSKFLYYILTSNIFKEYLIGALNSTTINNLNNTIMSEFSFMAPPLAEQERIVAILDKFEALTTSLSDGIPAEQAAQQKRYEYYRDLLLTFPRKEV